MPEKSHKQRVEQMVFAAHYAHSKARSTNQLKNLGKKAKRG